MKNSFSVLLVEDEPKILNGVKNALSAGVPDLHDVHTATNGCCALKVLHAHAPDFVITDLCMPVMDGVELVKQMRFEGFTQPVVILTALEDFASAQTLIRYGIENYIVKPFSIDEIIVEVSRVIDKLRMKESLDVMRILLDKRPEIVADVDNIAANASVREAKAYIKAHLSDSLTLQNIAGTLHISKAYLCTLFKRETGITVNEYITKQRMKEAKRLLSETDLRIGEICERIGYQSDKYFIQVFRTNEGTTPLAFRQGLRQQIDKRR